MTKDLYLIDVIGYLYRSYYALPRMTNPEGQSTHALYGFIRSFLRILKDFSPSHLVAVFDGPENKKHRTDIYEHYKAHRMHIPEDLIYQIDWASKFCTLYGVPQLSIEGVEADDTIGSIVKWATPKGYKTFICSGDKDFCQLISKDVFVLQTYKNNLIIDAQEVEKLYGIPPSLMVDYLALTGDQSDNIPGLPGFGPKTAAALLNQYGSLESLLAKAEQIGGKKGETLLQGKEMALVSQRLATIHTEVSIPSQEVFFQLGEVQEAELIHFYERHNFHALLKDLQKGGAVFSKSQAPEEKGEYLLVDSAERLKEMLKELHHANEVAFNVESTPENLIQAKLLGISFAIHPHKAWYLPFQGPLNKDALLVALKPIFEDPKRAFYGHHCKHDVQMLLSEGLHVANLSFDTMLASYLLHAHSNQHALSHLVQYYLKTTYTLPEKTFAELDLAAASHFACKEVDFISQLKALMQEELTQVHLLDLLQTIELPLVRVLAKMERTGIYLDLPYLQRMSEKIAEQIAHLEEEIYLLAGEKFNINSPKQLSVILYEKLGVKVGKKTSTGQASTSAEVLESLAINYPIALKLLEYRGAEKLRSTYVDKLPLDVNPVTHRVHCTFNQSVAATGRLSCQDPNLQNIPVRTEIGKEIREAFRPQNLGWSFLSADYSQIELRLLAHFSEDPRLIEAFTSGEDIHAFTASLIFNLPLKEVTFKQRYQAKAINFGIIYGQQAFGLSQETGISVKEAGQFIEAYFMRYSRVKEFVEACKASARETGRSLTLFGRQRQIPDMHSKNLNLRSAAERLAVNAPLQGTAADLIKMAMIEIDKKLSETRAWMLLQIHDELLFEVPDEELKSVVTLVKEKMQGVVSLRVPLVVDIAIGKNWKEC